jgi:hypothetical protein
MQRSKLATKKRGREESEVSYEVPGIEDVFVLDGENRRFDADQKKVLNFFTFRLQQALINEKRIDDKNGRLWLCAGIILAMSSEEKYNHAVNSNTIAKDNRRSPIVKLIRAIAVEDAKAIGKLIDDNNAEVAKSPSFAARGSFVDDVDRGILRRLDSKIYDNFDKISDKKFRDVRSICLKVALTEAKKIHDLFDFDEKRVWDQTRLGNLRDLPDNCEEAMAQFGFSKSVLKSRNVELSVASFDSVSIKSTIPSTSPSLLGASSYAKSLLGSVFCRRRA